MYAQEKKTGLVVHKEGILDKEDMESWPLLRPDKLTTLPTNLLRASAAELDTMCRQMSEDSGGLKYNVQQTCTLSDPDIQYLKVYWLL